MDAGSEKDGTSVKSYITIESSDEKPKRTVIDITSENENIIEETKSNEEQKHEKKDEFVDKELDRIISILLSV